MDLAAGGGAEGEFKDVYISQCICLKGFDLYSQVFFEPVQ